MAKKAEPHDGIAWIFIFFVLFCLLIAARQLTSGGYIEPGYTNTLTPSKYWEK